MKQMNFRLSEIAIDQLKKIAEDQDDTLSSAIHFAIQKGYDAIHMTDTCYTQKSDENDVWKELFLKEHEKLLELTDKVAESLHASQTLQALDKPSSSIKTLNNQTDQEELPTQPKPKSRWQRLKDAW